MSNYVNRRHLPIGAELIADGVSFRVWAPERQSVKLAVNKEPPHHFYKLKNENNGYFSADIQGIVENTLYQYQLDDDDKLYPDPASRYQPYGPHGPSQVINPNYPWKDDDWRGIVGKNQVIYELHIGTFTQEGTWRSAAKELSNLATLGINIIQIMPICEFDGKFGWGYDGVNFFAPYHIYGVVNDVKHFINLAHQFGLAVILDVVYNHVGCEGNYLSVFDRNYFSYINENDWGQPINFDNNARAIREFFLINALYWTDEYHFDGLRLDATQSINDNSSHHIIADITKFVRKAIKHKQIYIVAENEPQDVKLLKPVSKNGYGIDAVFSDDFHHSAIVKMLGSKKAYYKDHEGKAQELLSAIKYGYLYQGQWYTWQARKRGTPVLDIDLSRFINYLENHDQVANFPPSARLHSMVNPSMLRVMTALLLLSPETPLLFQGQEFASSSPFYYFADHKRDISILAYNGRVKFCGQFYKNLIPEVYDFIPNPSMMDTFLDSKLDHDEKEKNLQIYSLHKDLLKLRNNDNIFNKKEKSVIDGAVIADDVFIMRFISKRSHRLLLVNMSNDFYYHPSPEPLIAPPANCKWEIYWSSEDPKYGGKGTIKLCDDDNWTITGNCLTVLIPRRIK